MSRSRAILGLALASLLAGSCGGGGMGDAGAADAGPPRYGDAGAADVVGGSVSYEDRPYEPGGFTGGLPLMPAAGVRVELHDARGVIVASARTAPDGSFRLSVPEGAELTARAFADVRHEGHGAEAWTRGEPAKIYSVEAPVSAGQTLDLVARWADGVGGPFNMVDVARRAFVVYAPHVGAPGPALRFAWEREQPFPCGSCFGDDVVSVGGQREDTDEYDDDILLHEIGHYWVAHYGRDTSPAGTHRDRQVAPELAYGEGLAYFFASLVRLHPVIVDTFLGSTRVIDIDRYLQNGEDRAAFRGQTAEGALREEIVAGIMWDAFDPPADDEPFDRVSLGLVPMLELLVSMRGATSPDVGASGVDLADFLRALECTAGVPVADVQALADDRAYPYTSGGC